MTLHIRNHRLGKMDHAEEILVLRFAPFVRSNGQEILGWRTAGVGYAHINASELFRYLLDEFQHRRCICDIQGLGINFSSSVLANLVSSRAQQLFGARTHRHLRTLASE